MLAVVGLTTVACQQQQPTTTSDSPLPPPVAPSSSTVKVSAGDPCSAGPPGCVQIGKADVDGDGELDPIGVAVHQSPGEQGIARAGTVFVRVATSTGVQAIQFDGEFRLPKLGSPAEVFVGAFLMSRPRGADLVIQLQSDFLTEIFTIIGWTNGALTPFPAPGRYRSTTLTHWQSWALTQAEGFRDTVICTDGSAIKVVHDIFPESEGVPVPGGGRRETAQYSFATNGWMLKDFQVLPRDQFSYDLTPGEFLCGDQRR